MIRVACQPLGPRIGDLEANRAAAVAAIEGAVAAGARLVVLPELCTSGYVFAAPEEAAALAVPADHELLADWAAAAAPGDAVVVGGFCELGADGELYNSAAVVDGDGVLAVYRKTHLWDRESLVFTPGDAPPPVVDTRVGRLGVLVCYDLEFCEMTRLLGLAGAEAIVVPTNWPLVPRPPGEHPPEVLVAMAAARTNGVFVACCDRTGTERGQEWTSGTCLIDTDGWIVAATQQPELLLADLDLARAHDKAYGERNDALGDRRPELYGAVVGRG